MTILDRAEHAVAAYMRRPASGVLMQAESTTVDDYADLTAAFPHLINAYGFGDGRAAREPALSYTPLLRCVDLVSSFVAWLITDAGLYVTDLEGNRSNSLRARRALRIIKGLPDGRTAAETFWRDCAADYCLHGNSMLGVVRAGMGGPNDLPVRLERMASGTVDVRQVGERIDRRIYEGALFDDFLQRRERWDARNVVHARWPLMSQTAAGSWTDAFSSTGSFGLAPSPVALISRAVRLGISADLFVADYFQNGVKSRLAISYPTKINKVKQDQIYGQLKQYMQKGIPLVLGGAPNFTFLNESPSDADTLKLREYQVAEVGSVFGVPGALLNLNQTSWGTAISELVRGFYSQSIRYRVAAFMGALAGGSAVPDGAVRDRGGVRGAGEPQGHGGTAAGGRRRRAERRDIQPRGTPEAAAWSAQGTGRRTP